MTSLRVILIFFKIVSRRRKLGITFVIDLLQGFQNLISVKLNVEYSILNKEF